MAQEANGAVPVYLPMATVHSAIDSLRSHGLPSRLDRSAWKSRSGADQTGLLSGFRFLGLIDDAGNTQPALRALVEAEAASVQEKSIWKELLNSRYGTVVALDLTSATPNQVAEAISAYGNPSASTKQRAVRFFLKTAQYCEMPVSQRLLKDLRERTPRAQTAVNGGADASAPTTVVRTRKRRQPRALPRPEQPASVEAGRAMKTIRLPGAGGTLTLSGTFNPFELVGRERAGVYAIIDKMNELESSVQEEE